jgi:hypothetical protein
VDARAAAKGVPRGPRRLVEAEEARDVADAIVDSLEMAYSIDRHCTADGWISGVFAPRRDGNGDEDDSSNRQG